MKLLTVKQVARASGVSVRALHHYDEIGLLKPASVGPNRYRYYGRDELLRLQQILIHRELGIPLGEIAAILDDPGFDRLETLHRQRERLETEAKRYAQLVRTIDRTIAELEGDRAMKSADLYKGFSPEKQAEYEAWLIEKYGGDMPERIAVSRKKYESLADAEKARLQDELLEVESAWAEAMKNGVPAESRALDPLLARHRAWVSVMWSKPCPPEAYAGLADLHLGHPDFVARYEAIAPGFSDYHAASMKAYAARLAA
ncbi:MAG TPA: MerR family transcriptional regulator [Devosia sp.]|nr:MerR family transcriptional regulator [Devosia sp.]